LTTRGAPERWEAETLFSETRLEEALESTDSDAQAEELRQLFLERRIETGRFEPHPDPWDCLLGSLAIGQGDWDSLRTTDGADVVRGAQGTKVGWLAMALVVGGFGLCSVSAAMRLPELGLAASWRAGSGSPSSFGARPWSSPSAGACLGRASCSCSEPRREECSTP
jgi:hypothetical protein